MPAPISPNLFNTLPSAAATPNSARPQSAELATNPSQLDTQRTSFRDSLNQLRQKRREAAAASTEHAGRAKPGKSTRASGAKRGGAKKADGAAAADERSTAKAKESNAPEAGPEDVQNRGELEMGKGAADHADARPVGHTGGEEGPASAADESADAAAEPQAMETVTKVDSADAESAQDPDEAEHAGRDQDDAPESGAGVAAHDRSIAIPNPALAADAQGAAPVQTAGQAGTRGGESPASELPEGVPADGRQGGKSAVTPLGSGRRTGGQSAAGTKPAAQAGAADGAAQVPSAGAASAPDVPPAGGGTSSDAPAQELDEAIDPASPSLADGPTSGAPPTIALNRFASQLNETVGGASPSSHATGATASADAPDVPAPPPEARFAEANHPSIVRSIRQELLPTGGTMRLRLDPAELGAIQVTVRMRDGAMTASFETSSDHATSLLSHSLGQLKAALESQGVQVDRLHVQQSPREQSSQQQQQQGGDHPRDSSNPQDHPARQEQQRRELLRRMWRRMSGGQDPLDLVA